MGQIGGAHSWEKGVPCFIPRDPITETENGFMEPKYLAFRFGDCTPLAHHLTFGLPGSLGHHFLM